MVQTDPGFLDPAAFSEAYRPGAPGVQSSPGEQGSPVLVWNSSVPGFGAFATATWPPTAVGEGHHAFSLPRASFCKDIDFTTTDGSSCRDGGASKLQPQDKVTAHLRAGFTLHILNSTRVHTQHFAIHGAPGFAITEYDGYGAHSYLNVSLGRRHVSRPKHPPGAAYDSQAMCGTTNPTGGRLCLGMIASNNDGQ